MNPYELKPQSATEWGCAKYTVRFLGDDGGIKSGIIVAVLPSKSVMCLVRILDIRRNEFYEMYENEFQVIKPRKD